MKKFDLEDRLINFSVTIIDIVNETPKYQSRKSFVRAIGSIRDITCIKLW